METKFNEVIIPIQEVPFLVDLLYLHGCKEVGVCYINARTAKITFFDEQEYTVFVISDFLNRAKEESRLHVIELDLDFIRRIEMKLKSFDMYSSYYGKKKS